MFEYKCEKCGIGTVHAKTIEGYQTRILGYPFVVPHAVIGVCDHCGEHHFSSREAKRWEEVFYRAVEDGRAFLGPEEITSIRSVIGLSREEFALLIGCTRQSLHNWEKANRKRPQSRMGDLLIKLVGESRRVGRVDVIGFLVEQARNLGVETYPRLTNVKAISTRFHVVKASAGSTAPQYAPLQLAAAEAEAGMYLVKDEAGEIVGMLRYDYENADLYLASSTKGQEFANMVVQLVDKDGRPLGTYPAEHHGDRVILAHDTEIMPDRVGQIVAHPMVSGGCGLGGQDVATMIDRLESLLREYKLQEHLSGERAGPAYEEICRLIFADNLHALLWDEPVLLLLRDLFRRRPPNRQRFGRTVDEVVDRAQLVGRVNNLFFALIDPNAGAEKVVERVAALVPPPPQLGAALVAGARIEELRKTDDRPTEKIAAALEHISEDLRVDFSTVEEALGGVLDTLRRREDIGRIWALVVHEPTGQALALQMQVRTQEGKGGVIPLVDSSKTFESAVRRAREALQGHGFIHKDYDLLYGLSLTTGEYVGNSVALAAALGGYSAAGGITFDPYTAATGDILPSGQQWRIGSIGHLRAKLNAARCWGIRRVVVPSANVGESTESQLEVVAAEDLLEAIMALQPAARPLPGTSASVRKINRLQAIAQERGWHLSPPQPVQSGLQFTLSPLVSPDLKVVIYNTGAHSPKTHTRREFQEALGALALLDEQATPIRKVEQVLAVKEPGLRQEIRQALQQLEPTSSPPEQYCEYVLKFEDGVERLTVKQYQSGKLVLQGQAGSLAKRILEAIATRYNLRFPQASIKVDDLVGPKATAPAPRVRAAPTVAFPYIGTDESGKGDYFGPMVVAGVWVDENISAQLVSLGVRDSKLLSEARCRELAGKIRALLKGLFEEVVLVPDRYNDLYEEMKREGKHLNHMLAWGHARAIESIMSRKSAKCAVADQFGDESYIRDRLMEKGKRLDLVQIPKGEKFVAVAAASILARDSFLSRLDRLSQEFASALPKGASDEVVNAARKFVGCHGKEALSKVAKLHHRTTAKVLS